MASTFRLAQRVCLRQYWPALRESELIPEVGPILRDQNVCVCVSLSLSLCMYLCMYTYICMYVYTHINMYIYIYIHVFLDIYPWVRSLDAPRFWGASGSLKGSQCSCWAGDARPDEVRVCLLEGPAIVP